MKLATCSVTEQDPVFPDSKPYGSVMVRGPMYCSTYFIDTTNMETRLRPKRMLFR